MKKFKAITVVLAIAAVAMLVASGPLTKAGILNWRIGLMVFALAGLLGAIAVGAALALFAMPRGREPKWLLVVVMAAGLASVIPLGWGYMRARAVPPIHDITTDTQDPPAYVALAQARKDSSNGLEYGGPEVARQQRGFYADVYPVVVKAPPAEAHQKALDAARACGWDVVSSDAPSGRIEATATTRWFGFVDDIVIRVKPVEGGSKVDVRSASRVGTSDVGANAARIKEFLGRLS